MQCIWCQEIIYPDVSWATFLLPEKITPLCQSCQSELQVINRVDCRYCGRQYNTSPTDPGVLCHDCYRWQQVGKSSFTKNRSVFQYNTRLQAMITRWKYRGDYAIVEAFRDQINQCFTMHYGKIDQNTVIVPIPLSKQRLQHRAFNQAEAIAAMLPLPTDNLLSRVHSEKQAKKSRKERIASVNPFQLCKPTKQSVLLIDDIYTTGMTLQHAATTLKQGGCPRVSTFTLAR